MCCSCALLSNIISVRSLPFYIILVELITGEPDYHPGARQFDRNLFDMERTRLEVGPAVPPPDTLIDSLAQEWSDKDYSEGGRDESARARMGSESMWSRSGHGSSVSIPSKYNNTSYNYT